MSRGNTVTMFQSRCLNRFLTKYLEKFVMVDMVMLEEVEDLEALEALVEVMDGKDDLKSDYKNLHFEDILIR